MTERGDRGYAVLDLYIATQLTKAAETYASSTDIEKRINAILAVEPENEQGDAAAADR